MLGLLTRRHLALCVGIVSVGLLIGGCTDDGKAGVSSAMVTGAVTNTGNSNAPLAGVTVMTTPTVAGVNLVTNLAGDYSGELPVGVYELAVEETNYEDAADNISVLAGIDQDVDFDLVPVADVVVEVSDPPADPVPSAVFNLTATVTPMDGTTVASYLWSQSASAPAMIANPGAQTCTITLGNMALYKAELLMHIDILDRWIVQGINPFSLEEAGHVAFQCLVTMSDGSTYTESVDVHTSLSAMATWSTGLRTVPTGRAVFITGGDEASWSWTIAGPGAAVLMDVNSRHPYFTPDVDGTYTLTETTSGETIEIMSGRWTGAITGIGPDGRPLAGNCTGCHADTVADWRDTGHAEIFTDNVNTSGHYSQGCFDCHTVGFDLGSINNGIDEQGDYNTYLAQYGHVDNQGVWHSDPDAMNWKNMWGVGNGPPPTAVTQTASMANIQCENCHGPQNAGAHMGDTSDRVDISSDVCAFCHGEPKRHARFQQWELSGHGNYELAIDENGGSCQDCHTGQGWLAAYPQWETPTGMAGPRPNPTDEQTHPQTCAVCHDPHDVGTTSGAGTNAPVRIQDNSYNLAAGFDATNVGKGAICTTCHNGRRGTINNQTGLPNPDRAPHGGPQTDVLFGQNALFVQVGNRSAHSFLTDTCVTCHMQLTPPPAELSYNLGGTNHTFEASHEICTECHGAYDGGTLEQEFHDSMEDFAEAIQDALFDEIEMALVTGYTVEINGTTLDETADVDLTITDISLLTDITLTEYHGRSAAHFTYDGVTSYNARLDGDTTIWMGMTDSGSLALNGLFPTNNVAPYTQETAPEVLVAQAAYNYFLLHSDGSNSFHYPSFVGAVLSNSMNVLDMLNWSFLYVMTGKQDDAGDLYKIDPVSLDITSIGGGGNGIVGMAFHPTTGVLYGTGGSASAGLFTINLTTGATSTIATYAFDDGHPDLTFIGTDLYGSPGFHGLATINLTTGARTDKGSQMSFGGSGLVYNGTLYLTMSQNLYTVDESNGTQTLEGTLTGDLGGDVVTGMTFHQGVLYGVAVTQHGASHRLVTIDPSTLVVTELMDLPTNTAAVASMSP